MKKSRKKWYIIGIILIGVVGYMSMTKDKNGLPDYEYMLVEHQDLVQEVSVTGRVNPVESIDLAFERGGRIREVHVDIGDIVIEDEVLAMLDQTELRAQLASSQATLDAARATLADKVKGATQEEIRADETSVVNAENTRADARAQLLLTEENNEALLSQAYSAAQSTVKEAIVEAKNAIVAFTDIQQAHYSNSEAQGAYAIAQKKALAIEALFGETGSGNWIAEYVSNLSGGLFGDVQGLGQEVERPEMRELLDLILQALTKTRDMYESLPVTDMLTSEEKTTLSTKKSALAAQVSLLTTRLQAISVQEATAGSSRRTAQGTITTAENALRQANDQLALTRSGATTESINALKANVRSAEANVSLIRAQLSKTVLRSPIDGVVTKQDIKVGETATAFVKVLSIISEESFEIELFVAEADIAKISVGDEARVTLDAYGDDEDFMAEVISIDPAEVIKAGVSAYRVILHFYDTRDMVRSGMTANTDILSDSREDVLAVRSRAVLTQDGNKYVRVLKTDGTYKEVPVQVGMKSSNGEIEILEGLKEGDKVITYIPK